MIQIFLYGRVAKI